jgi:hypothetical protein
VSRGKRELLLFLAADGIYDAARWIGRGNAATADAHSQWIARIEHSLGIGVEASVQHALSSSRGAPRTVWLYRRAPQVYPHLRSTILATWAIAVPIFALFPVARPRLADVRVVDTVSRQTAVTLTGHSTLFYNPLAAIPSLHVGLRSRSLSRSPPRCRARGYGSWSCCGGRW